MAISLYIHIPFCARKCAYCDFASYAGRLGELPGYLNALAREMEAWQGREVATVYIGGGTPSLMSGSQLRALMDAVRAHFVLLPGAEVSMEANPGTVDLDTLRAYREAGINRLSLGAQAMQPHLLGALGRIHSWPQLEEAVELARQAGFQNLNIDLMYALPGQTMDDWRDTLRAAIGLAPEHISAYSLILEPGTPLGDSKDLDLPDEDAVIEMQRMATKMLAEAGLGRYEISNYARRGFECRHNIVYWTRGEYLGLGAAAHSLMGGQRFANSPEIALWRERERRRVTPEEAFEERVMLGTRMVEGIGLDGIDPARIDRLVRLGFVEIDQGLFRLTERGMEIHNAVVLELLA